MNAENNKEEKETRKQGVTANMLKSWFEQSGRIIGSDLLEAHEKEALTEIGQRVKEQFSKKMWG